MYGTCRVRQQPSTRRAAVGTKPAVAGARLSICTMVRSQLQPLSRDDEI